MIGPKEFADKQMELVAEFGKFVFDHPELDEQIPNGACIFFELDGETEFNRYSRKLAEKERRRLENPVVIVRVKGLAPPQGSRLIEPAVTTLDGLNGRSHR